MGRRLLLLFCTALSVSCAWAQCPNRDSVRAQAYEYGNFSRLPPKERLSKLLALLKREQGCSDPYDSTHAILLRKIGGLYFIQNDYLNALEYYRRSLNVIQAHINKPSINQKDQIGLYFWLSSIYDSLKNFREAAIAGDSCIKIAARLNASADISCVRAIYAKTEHDYAIGDYQRCIQDASICEKLSWEYAKSGGPGASELGMGHAQSSLGWHVQSLLRIKEFDAARQLLANKLEEFKTAGLKQYLGMIYNDLAELQIARGHADSAMADYQQSLYFSKISGNDFNYVQTLKDIGYNVYFNLYKDFGKALFYYQTALKQTVGKVDADKLYRMEAINILTNIASAWAREKRYDSAAHYFQRAFSMIETGTNPENILAVPIEKLLENGKIDYVLRLVTDEGDAYRMKYQNTKQADALRAAIRDYKSTDVLLEKIKFQQADINSKLFWRRDMHRMYEHAIDATLVGNDPSTAFYFFERSRAVILNDQITEQRWQSEKEIMEQTQLKKLLQNLEAEMASVGKSSDAGVRLQSEFLDKRQRLDDLTRVIREKHPLYYQRFLDSARITLTDVRNTILSDHQALIELFEGDSAVYMLLVTPATTRLKKISKQDFDGYTARCNDMLANADSLNGNIAGFAEIAHNLYQLIFEEMNVPPGRIIISPDGPYFPFEALVTDNSKPAEPVYFLKDHAVSYAYSARYLLNDFSNKGQGDDFLGVAPVRFGSGNSLSDLIGSDRSLHQIGSYFHDPAMLTASAASRSRFMDVFSDYRIIHLYTHSSDHSERGEPVIYFSDAPLFLSELIPERKPIAQLVVLSACETGNGQLNRGEGVFSFNRAFAVIGIPASVINLWEVDDKATYRLTEIFYKYLSKGLPIDLALQKAKWEFIQTGPKKETLPYYWAAAVVAGKTDAIQKKKKSGWPYYSIFAGTGILVLLLGWLIWKKRKN